MLEFLAVAGAFIFAIALALIVGWDSIKELLAAMSDLVSPDDIERIVGMARHPTMHYGRAVTAEQTVYILHSQDCKNSGIDLRDCIFSQVLDRGIDMADWVGQEDLLVSLRIRTGRLVPYRRSAQ